MIEVTQLNHSAIHVKDVEESCKFYGQILGLKRIARPKFDFEGAWFQIGKDQELHIIGGRDIPVVSHPVGRHFALKIKSINKAVEFLEEIGIIYNGVMERPDGTKQIFLIDPDGNYVELFEELRS